MKKRFADGQVVRILGEAESKQESIRDVCKRHNIALGLSSSLEDLSEACV